MSEKSEMSLNEALHILASIHTRDNDDMGFTVEAYLGGDFIGWQCSREQYIEAWKAVRKHLYMQTEPRS
jgi:hypothetical protein